MSQLPGLPEAPSSAPPRPARTGQGPTAAEPHAPGARRRTAWDEGVHRLRAEAVTVPGRLRITGAVLAGLVLLCGVLTGWQVSERTDAADAVIGHSSPLGADAARIHRSLADADTAASSGFLAGGQEPEEVRRRYEKDVRTASLLLTRAAARTGDPASAQREISRIGRRLPVYTGLVEAARVNNRQELPLGGAYLRYANEMMRADLLPAAKRLYRAETSRLDRDLDDAGAAPWLAFAGGALALGALGAVQRREFLRTNRVFNPGLLGATAATLTLMLWLTAGHAAARVQFGEAEEKGSRSLHALNDAWTGALQARADENMTLVARGADNGYEASFVRNFRRTAGSSPSRQDGGALGAARARADDRAGREPVDEARRALSGWHRHHTQAREKDASGDYEGAVAKVVGAKGSTGASFDRVDGALERAVAHEQRQFDEAAASGRAAGTGLAAGAGVLAVAGAVAAVWGTGRRLAEYR